MAKKIYGLEQALENNNEGVADNNYVGMAGIMVKAMGILVVGTSQAG